MRFETGSSIVHHYLMWKKEVFSNSRIYLDFLIKTNQIKKRRTAVASTSNYVAHQKLKAKPFLISALRPTFLLFKSRSNITVLRTPFCISIRNTCSLSGKTRTHRPHITPRLVPLQTAEPFWTGNTRRWSSCHLATMKRTKELFQGNTGDTVLVAVVAVDT